MVASAQIESMSTWPPMWLAFHPERLVVGFVSLVGVKVAPSRYSVSDRRTVYASLAGDIYQAELPGIGGCWRACSLHVPPSVTV